MLHREFTATVVRVLPWGVIVRTAEDLDVAVDNIKAGGHRAVGEEVLIVILDDMRQPLRGSCLTVDIEIGRRLRRHAEASER